MNMEIGTKAAQFPENKYIKGIFVAVHNKFRWTLHLALVLKQEL